MDEARQLIIIKGENKTREVQSCIRNPRTQQYDITFYRGGNTYSYSPCNVECLCNPEKAKPSLYHIFVDGKKLENVQSILIFKGKEEWWHIRNGNGRESTYPKAKLHIEKTCMDNAQSEQIWSYLKKIASIHSPLEDNSKNMLDDDGVPILKRQYEKLTFVRDDSVLANYLCPEAYPIRPHNTETLIFPFGGNASQFQAVKNAMSQQLSVIQGPPGTGKTQTILNIIANLLVQGKTIQVVAYTNYAIQNVVNKLGEADLGFLAAILGGQHSEKGGDKEKNKRLFFEKQTGEYPDMSTWQKNDEELNTLQEKISKLSTDLELYFQKQQDLALAKQSLRELDVEAEHFAEYYNSSKHVKPNTPPRAGLKSETVLHLLQQCEAAAEQGKPLGLWLKLECTILYGAFERQFLQSEVDDVTSYLQNLFYSVKKKELSNRIDGLQDYLTRVDAKGKMDTLVDNSNVYLKAYLFKRYGGSEKRKLFKWEDTWKNPEAILQEYPIIASTTFSAINCLNDVHYDYLIMDEASQVDLATGALALACANNAVIVGDLNQLTHLVNKDLRESYDKAYRDAGSPKGYNYVEDNFLKSICTVLPKAPQTLLREHYRCHPKIIGFCNQKFYQNQLVIMTEDTGEKDPLCVYETVPGNFDQGEHINNRQIEVTQKNVIPGLSNINPNEISVIAPYRNHVNKLSVTLQGTDIEVETVHKFQGREKDVIIINMVDNQPTVFSDDARLLNVAVSRAKKKLCLVVSGNEQALDSNIQDLISYIRYNNCTVQRSEIRSVFDLLYRQYTQERLAYLAKHKRVSEYDSENLMYATITNVLSSKFPGAPLNVICHQKLRMLIQGTEKLEVLTENERRYAMNPNTHVDFLIYNSITKRPVLAIEVDGVHFHKVDSEQKKRDKMKDDIFSKCGIKLLRFATNGSGEAKKLRKNSDL